MFDGISLAAVMVGIFGKGEKRNIITVEDTRGLEAGEVIEADNDGWSSMFGFH